jgi:tetratricopeptide (TPR) repeat protein
MPHQEKGQAEIITPVKMPGRKERVQTPGPGRQSLFKFIILVFILLLMAAGGVWMLYSLSENPMDSARLADETAMSRPESKEMIKEASVSKRQPYENSDPERVAVEKENAEQRLADFILSKNELENKGASEWGGDIYTEMIRVGREADELFLEKDYVSASEKYTDAVGKANELAAKLEDVFQQLKQKGLKALDEGDGKRAQEAFTVALKIEPTSEFVKRNLEKAKKIETVMQLIESGKQHEKNANLYFAHADYQDALRLDPESIAAQEAVNRVKDQIKDEEFQKLMSEGLTAYHSNKYELAKDKLLGAKAFRPESREVKDALALLDQAIRLDRIEDLRKNAVRAEDSEDWEQALKFHMAVLEIDANVQFASQGKERSLVRIQIEKRINFFLQNPGVLESDQQLENAVSLVHEVKGIEPKGPAMTAHLRELTQLVTAAQTPVRLIIESDNLTEVAVYRVGKLGRFNVRELDLRPGTYTVVGVRDGYKDVSRKIVIKPNQGSLRITVKCKAEI